MNEIETAGMDNSQLLEFADNRYPDHTPDYKPVVSKPKLADPNFRLYYIDMDKLAFWKIYLIQNNVDNVMKNIRAFYSKKIKK